MNIAADFKIRNLKTLNFRNLNSDEIIQFGPSINCIFGDNGNGKTNILEAIHLLSTKKSFRKNTGFPQFLSIDGEKPEVILSASFATDSNNSIFSYNGVWNELSNQWLVDGKSIKKRPAIKVVFINPFDSYNFHNTSSFRRNWFDTYMSKMDKVYRKKLNRHNLILRQRNTLLSKKPAQYKKQIFIFDQEMAPLVEYITAGRVLFLKEISSYSRGIFQDIFSEAHQLELILDSALINKSSQQIFDYYQNNLKNDELIGHTKKGIHRDDYVLHLDGLNSFDYCSLGQQKMSYLSLLFAYIELFWYKCNSYPIVLIDDVSGELDSYRWKRLVNYLKQKKFQVLITTANALFKEELEKIESAVQINVCSGNIS